MCENDGYIGRSGQVFQLISSGDLELDTSAYASGDVLTDGYIVWNCVAQTSGWGACIKQVNIVEDAGSGNNAQTLPGKLLIFKRPPTLQTKNTALNLTQSDVFNLVAEIELTSGVVYQTRYSFKNHDSEKWVQTYAGSETSVGDTALYGIFILNANKTFASGTKLQIHLGVIKD